MARRPGEEAVSEADAKAVAALLVACVLIVFAIDTIFFASNRERKK